MLKLKCSVCGTPFQVENKGANKRKKFCSKPCRYKASNLKREKKPIKNYSRVCAHCSKSFETIYEEKIYCSSNCKAYAWLAKRKRKATRKKALETIKNNKLKSQEKLKTKELKPGEFFKNCGRCKKLFIGFEKNHQFCSRYCATYGRFKLHPKGEREKTCPGCLKTFFSRTRNFCSSECGQNYVNSAFPPPKNRICQNCQAIFFRPEGSKDVFCGALCKNQAALGHERINRGRPQRAWKPSSKIDFFAEF